MIGEGGDDIFVGSDAQDKMDGMSGFDWVTYKNDISASRPTWSWLSSAASASSATTLPRRSRPRPASILDRFAEVEGLSGTAFTDILRGDNVDAATIVNHGGATGGALTNLALIDGLRNCSARRHCHPIVTPASRPATSSSAATAATSSKAAAATT